MNCENCGKATVGYELHDYCAICSKNLCADCMAEGHCGNTPALGGMNDPCETCGGLGRIEDADKDQHGRPVIRKCLDCNGTGVHQ